MLALDHSSLFYQRMSQSSFVNKTKGFTSLENGFLNNPELSTGDKGLYAYLKSKPSGWNFSSGRIANDHREGIRAIRASLARLEEHGLIKRCRQSTGRVLYEVHDPQCSNAPVAKRRCGISAQGRNVTRKKERVISKKEKEVRKRERGDPAALSIFDLFPVKTRKDDCLLMIENALDGLTEEYLSNAIKDYAEATSHWPDELKPKIKTSYYFLLDKTYLDDSESYWKTPKPKAPEPKKDFLSTLVNVPENWRDYAKDRFSGKGDAFWDGVEFGDDSVLKDVWREILNDTIYMQPPNLTK